MGGPDICPPCDCGVYRDGTRWEYRDALDEEYRRKRALEHSGKGKIAMNIEREVIDKAIENEIDWLRHGFKVLVPSYWKKENFEKRYGFISDVEWEKFLDYMKVKGHKLNDVVYELSDEFFRKE
jgi:hypothetical protein